MKNHIKLYEEYSNESQFFKTYEQTKEWLDEMGIKNYTIGEDLKVSVDGRVVLEDKNLKVLPVRFSFVEANFNIAHNQLTTLKGCPAYIGAGLELGINSLTDLKHFPIRVGGYVNIGANQLVSLEGVNENIGEWLGVNQNKLTSLVFAPKEPSGYDRNPCTDVYKRLGFTTKAHVEALRTLDPNPADTIQRLKKYNPVLAKELSLELGFESEELESAYKMSKDVEGDFY